MLPFSILAKIFFDLFAKGLFFTWMKSFFKDVLRRMAVLFVSAFLFAIISLVLFSFFAGSFLSPTDEKIKKDSFSC